MTSIITSSLSCVLVLLVQLYDTVLGHLLSCALLSLNLDSILSFCKGKGGKAGAN